MPVHSSSRKRLRSLCAEVYADDGSDPRTFFHKDGSRAKPRYKALQLCRQVSESLSDLLACGSSDERSASLTVISVTPAPDAATLLVTVSARTDEGRIDPAETLARLDRASGWLRSGVAAAITRKRAPLLIYRVVEIGPAIVPTRDPG